MFFLYLYIHAYSYQCCQATGLFLCNSLATKYHTRSKIVCLLTAIPPLNVRRGVFIYNFWLIISSLMLDPLNHYYFTLVCYAASILIIKGKAVGRGAYKCSSLSLTHTYTQHTHHHHHHHHHHLLLVPNVVAQQFIFGRDILL